MKSRAVHPPPVGAVEHTEGAECLHCGRIFQPRRRGHVFCSTFCRHRGQRPLEERLEIDTEAVRRLFDPSRDPNELVREDDWIAGPPDTGWRSLYRHDQPSESQERRFRMHISSGQIVELDVPAGPAEPRVDEIADTEWVELGTRSTA